MEIRCATCVLRPLVASDAASLAANADDRDVWLNLRDRFPHPYAVADAEGYIAAVSGRPVQTSFGIVVDGEAAGGISLMLGEDVERFNAEVGYWLGRRFWGRGIATDAVVAVTRYAFETLGMRRVFAVPFAHNAASSRVLEKAGYAREGRLRRSAVKDGVIHDQWLYAACDDDWSPPAGGAAATGRIVAIDHVQLAMPAGREDDARAFYAGVLGLGEVPKPPVLAARGGAWFAAGPVQLHLGVENDFRPAAKAHPALRVTGLDALAERCRAAGFAPVFDGDLPGFARFYVADPFGNRLELLEPLAGRGEGAA